MVYGKVIGVNIMFHVSIEPWVANKHTISVSGFINNFKYSPCYHSLDQGKVGKDNFRCRSHWLSLPLNMQSRYMYQYWLMANLSSVTRSVQ